MINPLRAYFRRNPGRLIHKWDHYFDLYHRHFSPWRGKSFTMIEIGISHGGSLQMWKQYFGPKARIIGVDIEERTKSLAEPQVEVMIGDQSDPRFLRELAEFAGPVDIVLDDGGHTMEQQLRTFEELWPIVRPGGVYVVEDLHTSYWPSFGGGLRREGTFIEFTKGLIDRMHSWHVDGVDATADEVTTSLRGMHVYDSLIVFDKGVVTRPYHERTGRPAFPLDG